MLRQVLRRLGAHAAPPLVASSPNLATSALIPKLLHGGSWREQTTQEGGRMPTATPPDDPPQYSDDFDRVADLYLGGLWSKMEAALEGGEGKGKQVDAQLEHTGLKLELPEGGKITITKDPGSRSLVVHSNIHDFYGSDGTDTEVPFRLQADKTWELDGEELHEFIEDGLAKHLKVQVDLEPEDQTQYGPDPT